MEAAIVELPWSAPVARGWSMVALEHNLGIKKPIKWLKLWEQKKGTYSFPNSFLADYT